MEIRSLRASDLDQAFDLDADAFHEEESRRESWKRFSDPDRLVGAFEDGRLLAMTGAHELGQFFGGRSVPMGGVYSVAVAPHARGRGLAGAVLRRCIEDMRERGEVISSLFPATTGLYRSHGWELAGHFVYRKLAPRSLRGLARPEAGALRPFDEQDRPEIRRCYEAFATPVNGCLDRPRSWWERKEFRWQERDVYVFEGEGGALEGYLVYRQIDGEYSHLGGDFGLAVDELVATTRDAALGLWGLLAGWGTQVDQVVFHGAADDPVLLLLPEQVFETMAEIRWMTRVNDAVGAVAARGFPASLDLEVPLRLRDPDCAANDGGFVLTVGKGRGTLAPAKQAGGPGLDVNGFSSLFTGWAGTAALARAKRLEGGSAEERARLDAAFGGATPWMLEEF